MAGGERGDEGSSSIGIECPARLETVLGVGSPEKTADYSPVITRAATSQVGRVRIGKGRSDGLTAT